MAKDLKQKREHAIERVGYSDTGQPSSDLEAYKTRNNDGTTLDSSRDIVEPGSSFRRLGGGLSTVQSVENIDTKGTDEV